MNPARETPVVLVVDDEASICCCLTDALSVEGYKAMGATNLQEALALAKKFRPDIVVTDLRLQAESGLDVVAELRRQHGNDLPAVIITGHGDLAALSAASRLRPVEVIDKPVDLQRLSSTVRAELQRLRRARQAQKRMQRIRQLAHKAKNSGRRDTTILSTACADLTSTCQHLQGRLERQESVIHYQADLMGCSNEDDIFRRFFKLFVERNGAVFGVALLCDSNAELQMVGRFGVPNPDGPNFCNALSMAMVPSVLQRPEVQVVDCVEHISLFPESLHRKLIGVTVMAVPLMAAEGQMVGLVTLYRKGEQPFTEEDIFLASLIGPSTAAAAMRT